MGSVQELWPGPVCTQPGCLLKRKKLDPDELAEVIVRGLSRDRAASVIPDEELIEGRDVCKGCALRILQGGRALPTVEEKRDLIKAGNWSEHRRRR